MSNPVVAPLPSLRTFLRRTAAEINQKVLYLWILMKQAGVMLLSPEEARQAGRAGAEAPAQVDEAYLWVLRNIPEVAEGAGVSAEQYEALIDQEAAVRRLERALLDLSQAQVDTMYLVRAGLYAKRCTVDEVVARLLDDRSQPAWQHHFLSATWGPVAEVEAQAPDKAQKTRDLSRDQDKVVKAALSQVKEKKDHLAAIHRLLQVAGLAPKP
jgi:hypothetical protein